MPTLTPYTALTGHAARLALLVLAIALCYVAGLNSLFLFDDAPNLDALVWIQDASPLAADFREFVLGGDAGPTGRPFALFTFALQAGAWPDNPLAFKVVNLAIHCLNAILVYLLSIRLVTLLKDHQDKANTIALVVALAWALHPVHTSTVLYAVQRMALLSNFFMLLGIYLYLLVRQQAAVQASHRQLAILTLAIALPGLFALLSKENAPSLVFYLLALEYTLLKDAPVAKPFRQWRYAFLWLPAIVILLLPLVFYSSLQADFDRHFTFSAIQRLLTESRILWSYLGSLLLPSASDTGIFHDIDVSTSLWQPASTLVAVLAWLACLVLAVTRPGRHRLLPFALYWFLAGHIIESTVLPLELFFHHRNYLAFFGVVFTVVYAFLCWLPAGFLKKNLRQLVCGLYIGLLALNTFLTASSWANPMTLAQRWYEGDPATQRNAEFYAIQLTELGASGQQQAAQVLDQAIAGHQDNFRLQLDLLTLSCGNPNITAPAPDTLLAGAGNLSPENRGLVTSLQQLVSMHINGECAVYGVEFFTTLVQLLIDSTSGYDKGMFEFERARLANYQGEYDLALQLMTAAWENTGDPGILFNQAVQLINDGRYEEALALIDLATRETREHNNIRTGTTSRKLAILESMRQDTLGFMAGN